MPESTVPVNQTIIRLHDGEEMYVECLIQPSVDITYTVDGQDPTDTLGTTVYGGASDVIEGSYRIRRCKIRATGTGNGTLFKRLEWTGNRGRKA